jgi:hypothetical protein
LKNNAGCGLKNIFKSNFNELIAFIRIEKIFILFDCKK